MKKHFLQLFFAALCCCLSAFAQESTTGNEVNVTDLYVTNPLFSNNTIDGWQYDQQGSTPGCDWNAVEFYWSQGFDFYQTVTLPAGTYVLRGIAYYRGGGVDQAWAAHTAGNEPKHCWMYAGDERIHVMNMFDGNGPTEGNGWVCPPTGQKFPNWPNEARAYFDLGEYRDNVIEFTITEDGTAINLGFRKYAGEYEDWDWMMINGIELWKKVEDEGGNEGEDEPTPVAPENVTDLYLQNTGFDIDAPREAESYWDQQGGTTCFDQITGWTLDGSGGGAGAAFAYGSTPYGIWQQPVPDTDKNGAAEGNCLGLATSWNGHCIYMQSVTLKPGHYTMMVDIINYGTTANYTTGTGFYSAGQKAEISFPAKEEGWKTCSVQFDITSETTGSICVGYTAGNSGVGGVPKLYFDNVQLWMTPMEGEDEPGDEPAVAPIALRMDMVHHNPGDALYESRYNSPAEIAAMGYNAKCFYLFDSPTLAINWDDYDPQVLPEGSEDREWVEAKAARLNTLYDECKENSIDVYAMCDLVLLPKRLVELHNLSSTMGDPTNDKTREVLSYQIRQSFKQFPQLDGLVVRIGETYLEDAPYHQGKIDNKTNPDLCIIPLMQLLREIVCVELDKKLVFRTWLSFDTDQSAYNKVSEAVEPHDNLTIGVKHCEGDFHRGSPYSKVQATGRHRQVIEVQCAREYEGKGAFPNYIARGVIDGFEEDAMRQMRGETACLRDVYKSGLLAGVWTWTRGGGWEGPYVKDELWCDLNAWVMTQWAAEPEKTEEELFNAYATQRLGLGEEEAATLRQIALLSEHATLRGIRSAAYPDDVFNMWTRDEYITFPDVPSDLTHLATILAERDEAVKDWEEIVALSEQFNSSDSHLNEVMRVTCQYGLHMYRIFRSVYHLAGIYHRGLAEDKAAYIAEYEKAWSDLEQLQATYPTTCPTLYSRDKVLRTSPTTADGMIKAMEFGKVDFNKSGLQQRDITVRYLEEARAFARAEEPVDGKYLRYGQLKHWTVENLGIDMGESGINNGADSYNGVCEINMDQWYNGFVGTDSKIYRKVTLPAGRYGFNAYASSCYGMEDGTTYMFVSNTLPTTATISTLGDGCHYVNMATAAHTGWWGIEFELAETTEVWLGWCADFTRGNYELRVSDVQLVRAIDEEGGLPAYDDEALTTEGDDLYIPVSQWADKGTFQSYNRSCQYDGEDNLSCHLGDWKNRAAYVGDVNFGDGKYTLAYFDLKYDGASLYGNNGAANLAGNTIDLWVDNTNAIEGDADAVSLNGTHIASLPGETIGDVMSEYLRFEVRLAQVLTGVHRVYFKMNGYAPLLHGIGFVHETEDIDVEAAEAEKPVGKMSQEASDNLDAALATLKTEPTHETLAAYEAACTQARASIAKYAALKQALDHYAQKQAELNNPSAKVVCYPLYAEGYEQGSIADERVDEAIEALGQELITLIKTQAAPADLTELVEKAGTSADGWTCTEGASVWHINSWSHESATDGTGFDTPFCEYWTWVNGNANVFLNDATISYSVDGLPAGRYEVSMRIRIMQEADYTYSTKEIEGVTMFAGDADLPITDGQLLEGPSANRGYYDTYTVYGNVDESGILTFGLRFADTNASWVIWKNIILKHLEDEPIIPVNIQTANAGSNTTSCYNLAGQKVKANYRGIVINNGVKTLNR